MLYTFQWLIHSGVKKLRRFSTHWLTAPYSLILFSFAALLCQSHQWFKRRRGPITALSNVGETETCTHTRRSLPQPPFCEQGVFLLLGNKAWPNNPKAWLKAKETPTSLPTLISLPPALWGLYKALGMGLLDAYVCVCLCVRRVWLGGGVYKYKHALALIILIMTWSEEKIITNTWANELLMSSCPFSLSVLPLKEADRQRSL